MRRKEIGPTEAIKAWRHKDVPQDADARRRVDFPSQGMPLSDGRVVPKFIVRQASPHHTLCHNFHASLMLKGRLV
jgi:hypothetical protein